MGLRGISGVGFSGVSVTTSCSIAFFALAAAAAIWSAVLGFRRLGVVDAGPATSNLRDEPPAVVNLLVHARGVKRSAFVATLLELAARDVTEVVEIEPGRYALRLSRDGAPLPTAIERMAVATLRSRRIRRSGISLRRAFPWYRFRPFVRAVVNEAVDRGLLVEQRFLYADWPSVLALVLVVAALLLADPAREPRSPRGSACRCGAGARSLASRRRHGVLTANGAEAAAHWKGVADYLRADGAVHECATDVGRDPGARTSRTRWRSTPRTSTSRSHRRPRPTGRLRPAVE